MPRLGALVDKVRSKNAGPFWVTVDIFCKQDGSFERICESLSTQAVAALYQVKPEDTLRFDIPSLDVIKFSFPRPNFQGTRFDRDMHGAAIACLLEEFEIT
ncbi:MAG: DUF4387 family protein [Pseudomonadota bacterium]